MHLKIRLQHKKLDAIMTMIEKTDRRIMLLTRQLEKYPRDIFWCNEHAKDINRFNAVRQRLYAYYASTFTAMAMMIAEKKPAPPTQPTGNYIRIAQVFETEQSIHLLIFS